MFDVLSGFDDAAALSDALKARAIAKSYGAPLSRLPGGPMRARKMHGWSTILRRTLEGFAVAAKALPASASGQAH